MEIKDRLVEFLAGSLTLEKEKVAALLEVPPDPKLGDLAFPCFELAKARKKAPNVVAQELAQQLKLPSELGKVVATGSYVNFFFNYATLARSLLPSVLSAKEEYGKQNVGQGKTLVMDLSSPNIAKPFGVGHLRSTVIGSCLYRVCCFLGYKPVGVNHLGDWGTQFGKLIVAYKKWGVKEDLEKDPTRYLLSLYVRFHEEAEKNPVWEEGARKAFKALEEGNVEYHKLWEWFRELSLKEFKRIYQILDVDFDYYTGESFYNDKMEEAIEYIQKKVATKVSDGALVVDLEPYRMPPVLLRKSDGATTYHTRDIAAALYRLRTFHPEKLVYVVGSEQKLHFQQLFKVLELAGESTEKFVHVDFGMFRLEGEKMATRKGKVIFLEEVLQKAMDLAKKVVAEKNPDLKNQEEVAKWVGVGSIIFADLSNDRIRDIDFDWDRMISFEGETAPYLQYTHARASSILRKAEAEGLRVSSEVAWDLYKGEEEASLVRQVTVFKEVLLTVLESWKPHHLADYLIRVAQSFNEFYHKCPVLAAEPEVCKARLLLVFSARQVLKNGLNLLQIEAPEEM